MNCNDLLFFSNPSRETLSNNYINRLEIQHEELKRVSSISIIPEEYKEEIQQKDTKQKLKRVKKKSFINIEEEIN